MEPSMRRLSLFSLATLMLLGACMAPAAADPPDRAAGVEASQAAPDPMLAPQHDPVEAARAQRLAQARESIAEMPRQIFEAAARAEALGVRCDTCTIQLEPDNPVPVALRDPDPVDRPQPFVLEQQMPDLTAALADLPDEERAAVLAELDAAQTEPGELYGDPGGPNDADL
jgi:hypothetical protein